MKQHLQHHAGRTRAPHKIIVPVSNDLVSDLWLSYWVAARNDFHSCWRWWRQMGIALAVAQIHLCPGQNTDSWFHTCVSPTAENNWLPGQFQVQVPQWEISRQSADFCRFDGIMNAFPYLHYLQSGWVAINSLVMYLSNKLEIHWKGQSRTSMEERGQEGCEQIERSIKEQEDDLIFRKLELQRREKPVGPSQLKKDWGRTQ